MNKIQIGQTQVAFDAAGRGPTVLFLHAFPFSSSMWSRQIETLAARYQVVRVDARGFGESDLGEEMLSVDTLARDAAAVLEHLGIGRAVVCGSSMGGYVAFAFAREFASRLAGLALIDTRAAADTPEARAGRTTLAEKVTAQGAAAVVEAMLPKLVGATSHRERPQVVEAVRKAMLEARPPAIVNALHALASRPDSRPTLAQIRVPTVILRGEQDPISTAEDAREMYEGIPGSRVVTIPHSGHLPPFETPGPFDEALSAFLERLP